MALRKDPAKRYDSAEQFADDVFRHLEHLPVQARRGAWGYGASRFLLRHRVAMGAAALANLALLAGLGLAAYQTIEANRQREFAQQHLRDTRQLANVLILDVYEAIRALPGSTAARQLVVRSALTYLERAARESAADSSQRLEVAKGFRNVGDLQGQPGYANLGDYQGALKTYDAALALLSPANSRASLSGSDRLALQQEMTEIYQRRGGLLFRFGRLAEALAAQRDGLALAAAVSLQRPKDPDTQSTLATLHGEHSEVLDHLGDLPAAAQNLDAAISLFETLAARDPDHLGVGLSLSTGYLRRGIALQDGKRGEPSNEGALREFHRSRQVLERLHALHPDDTSLVRSLAFNDRHVGDTMTRLGRPHEAVEHHRRAVQALVQLVDADPQNHQFRGDLVRCYGHLSMALEALGDLPGSVDAGRAAARHAEQLPASALANFAIRFGMGQALYALAHALDRQAAQRTLRSAAAPLRREACELYRQSLPLVKSSREQLPRARFNLNPETVQAALERCEKT